MKKIFFSALAVMAVGAAAFCAVHSDEEYASTLFLDSIEALADPTEGNNDEGCEQFGRPCTVTLEDGSTQEDKEWWSETGKDEGCIDFCICDACFAS